MALLYPQIEAYVCETGTLLRDDRKLHAFATDMNGSKEWQHRCKHQALDPPHLHRREPCPVSQPTHHWARALRGYRQHVRIRRHYRGYLHRAHAHFFQHHPRGARLYAAAAAAIVEPAAVEPGATAGIQGVVRVFLWESGEVR